MIIPHFSQVKNAKQGSVLYGSLRASLSCRRMENQTQAVSVSLDQRFTSIAGLQGAEQWSEVVSRNVMFGEQQIIQWSRR